MNNYEELLSDRVDKEYKEYKENVINTKTKEEIFDENYKIRFHEEMHEFLSYTDNVYISAEDIKKLALLKGNIFDLLYDYYIEMEYAALGNWEQISDWVGDFCKSLTENDLRPEGCE